MESESMDNLLADPGALHGATLLGRYRIDRPIGQGGMAHVYAARHVVLEREVAVKVLRQRFSRRQSVVERFLLEARAASRVCHPHVVEVTDFGTTEDGLVFMVMERLDGETLAETVNRDGALPWARVRDIALQLCDALQATHDAGIVHRDVSLKNCFRITRGRNPDYVKVLDFGIARVDGLPNAPSGRLRRLTSETQIMGTPEFMSPEQASRSSEVDPRSDVYAVGVLLYALLTGSLPFEAESTIDLIARHMYEPVPPMTGQEPEVPAEVESVVLKALAKEPEYRWQSMRELATALQSIAPNGEREIAEAPVEVASPVEPARLPAIPAVPRRPRKLRHVALVGAVVGLAWWGWRDRALFDVPTSATALETFVNPAPDGVAAAGIVAPQPIEVERPAAVLAIEPPAVAVVPASVRPPIDEVVTPDGPLHVAVPPPPPEPTPLPRRKHVRPHPPVPVVAASAPIEPTPPAEPTSEPTSEPTPPADAPVPDEATPEPDPAPEAVAASGDGSEVKDPFAQ